MTIAVTSPVSGGAQTGFTTPSFTVVSDTPPSVNAKTWAVTAISGTGTFGVRPHSGSDPFSITFARPASLRAAPVPNANNVIGNSPRNVFSVIVRKGETPVAGQSPQVAVLRCDLAVVAGADTVDADDVRGALSLLIGALTQQSAGLGDTLVSAIL